MFAGEVPYRRYDSAGRPFETPLGVVKAKSVDIGVRTDAEIVIEGYIPPKHIEEEGPFDERFGATSPRRMNPLIETTGLTYTKNPI